MVKDPIMQVLAAANQQMQAEKGHIRLHQRSNIAINRLNAVASLSRGVTLRSSQGHHQPEALIGATVAAGAVGAIVAEDAAAAAIAAADIVVAVADTAAVAVVMAAVEDTKKLKQNTSIIF